MERCGRFFPYATCYGEIDIPDSVPVEEHEQYIYDHFDDVKMSSPALDWGGTDFDLFEIEES